MKDPFEGIDNPTFRVQIQHELTSVTKLSFVSTHKDKVEGFRDTLSTYFFRGYDRCGTQFNSGGMTFWATVNIAQSASFSVEQNLL